MTNTGWAIVFIVALVFMSGYRTADNIPSHEWGPMYNDDRR